MNRLVFVVVTGLKTPVTPGGNCCVVSVTEPVKSPNGSTMTVAEAVPPSAMGVGTGKMLSENHGPVTLREKVVVSLSGPEVPVMVTSVYPTVADLLAVSMSSLHPVVGLSSQVAVTPAGRPDVIARLTLPVNP